MEKQFRHGDVFLSEVTRGIQGKTSREIILAKGETTGHAHVLTCSNLIQEWIEKEERFIHLDAVGVLTHEEHGVIEVPPGTYKVAIQQQYTPAEYRNVQD